MLLPDGARSTLFGALPSSPRQAIAGSSNQSARLWGKLQSWEMFGGSYENVRHLPVDDTMQMNVGFLDTLMHFKMVELPEPMNAHTYHGAVDVTHFYTLVVTRMFANFCLKFDRFTGALVQRKSTVHNDMTGAGPLFLYEKGIFLQSTANSVIKYNKEDLEIVWTFQLPYWQIVNAPLFDCRICTQVTYFTYALGMAMVLPPRNGDAGPTVLVSTKNSGVYGPSDFTFFAVGGGVSSHLQRLVQYHQTRHHTFGLIDLGSFASLAFDFAISPTAIKDGDNIPDESFPDGTSSIDIWDKLADGMVFSHGSSVTGHPKSTGSFIFPSTRDESTGPLYDMVQHFDTGFVEFRDFEIFNASKEYLMTNIRDGEGNSKSHRLINGSLLLQMPVAKTLYRGTNYTVNAAEAWGLNYFGGSVWGTPSFDRETSMVYLPSGNAYACPYSEQVAVRGVNDPERHVFLDVVFANYSSQMQRAHSEYMNGNQDVGFQLSKDAIIFWKEVELRRRAVGATLSPRYQRFFHGSVIALNAYTGNLSWATKVLGHDIRDNSHLRQPKTLLGIYLEYGTNHDILGTSIATVQDRKLLIATGKYSFATYVLSPSNAEVKWFRATNDSDDNAAGGLTSMRSPEIQVHLLMKTAYANHGGGVIHDGVFYKLLFLAEHSRAPALLPVMPVHSRGFDQPTLRAWEGPLTLWAVDILSGDIKWLRMIEASAPGAGEDGWHSGALTAYGRNLIVGDLEGSFHLIDMKTGFDRCVVPTLSSAVVNAPIVNGIIYHVGGIGVGVPFGTGGFSYARYLEMLTPLGN